MTAYVFNAVHIWQEKPTYGATLWHAWYSPLTHIWPHMASRGHVRLTTVRCTTNTTNTLPGPARSPVHTSLMSFPASLYEPVARFVRARRSFQAAEARPVAMLVYGRRWWSDTDN